jgi:hypothetical protein
METILIKKSIAESWENIKQRYPDSFVLLENPVYKSKYSPELLSGVFRYKNKSKRQVYKKGTEMNVGYSTVRYTGGKRLDELDENLLTLC